MISPFVISHIGDDKFECSHTMATQFGRLTEFQPQSDSVKAYLERVNRYFLANEGDAQKQVPILLSCIGATTYAPLSDLVALQAPGEKSIQEISDVLRAHFEPKRSVIAERFHFHIRDQAPGESIAEFDAALCKLATHCQFGANLADALRDRFVCGLQHDNIQRRLLSEAHLSYKKAMDIAKGMEAEEASTKAFRTQEPTIKRLDDGPSKSKDKCICYCCRRTRHPPGQLRVQGGSMSGLQKERSHRLSMPH